ncbi:MAG TPA: hypothetical protein VH855_11640 [Acetobacteraceae bacterium]|jgi:hypothetical protein
MRRLVLILVVSCFANSYPQDAGHAQPYYPYPPGYYAPGYYPPQYYRPPPPPYYAPPAYTTPYYAAPPAYNSANCGTPYEPKPCYR